MTKPPGIDVFGFHADDLSTALIVEGTVPRQPTHLQLNDRLPAFAGALYTADGEPQDLTGATVVFVLRRRRERTVKVTGAATVLDAATGRVSYAWQAGDTNEPGVYDAFFKVTLGGLVKSFPNEKGHEVRILP